VDENRINDESRLNFLLVKAFHCVSKLVEQVLQAALQPNNCLGFLARVASEVHGADELGSMGSSKVLLDNNSIISRERRRMESSKRVSLL
jgi:hypothetical protein